MSQENEGLNNDLEKVNEEYSKLMHCLSQTENNLKSMQNKLNEKIEEVLKKITILFLEIFMIKKDFSKMIFSYSHVLKKF